MKTRRIDLNFTLARLSEDMAIGVETIEAYESGRMRISVEGLLAFSTSLAVPASYFFEEFAATQPESPQKAVVADPSPASEDKRLSFQMRTLMSAFTKLTTSAQRDEVIEFAMTMVRLGKK